jgi:hypothetical protein
MKILFLFFALLSSAVTLAQDIKDERDYYLRRAKHQKTVGNIVAATGFVLFVSGLVVSDGKQSTWGFSSNFGTKLLLAGGGIVCGLASIPFYVSSRTNTKRASSVSVAVQRILIPPDDASVKILPSISLTLTL